MSMVQLGIWELILLFAMFVSVIWAAGKLLLAQIDKRLDARFESADEARKQTEKRMDARFQSMEEARKLNTEHWDSKFKAVLEDQQKGTEAWRSLERDFLKFRGDLPLEYVRREDFIRNQSVIEAKLDALALHIQNLQLKGVRHD